MTARPAILGLILLLAACKREPDFDARYKAADAKISQTSSEIDARIAATGAPQAEVTASTK